LSWLVDLGRAAIGLGSCALVLYWIGLTLPTLAEEYVGSSSVLADPRPPPPSPEPSAATPRGIGGDRSAHARIDTRDRTVTSMGCADGLDAESLKSYFAGRLGPLVGWDNPHIVAIDERRAYWFVQDAYVDYTGTAENIGVTWPQMQNVVFLQEGTCFTLVHGGSTTDWHNFETGDGHEDSSRFVWPLGGEIVGDVLWLFWAETKHTGQDSGLFAGGITRYPTRTWLASYDVDTLERLSFEPAPNSGVDPTYGFAVESDDEYSYLFANRNLLNMAMQGGFENGPHSATKMYIGRVPFGRFTDQPEYWNGTSWTDDPATAAVISERFWTENGMQPRYIEGRWLSVVKRDGFFGNEVVIDVAEQPWGPWEEVARIPHEPTPDETPKNSYHPVFAPWSGREHGLVIAISENAQVWDRAVERIDLYRPSAFGVEWPFADDERGRLQLTRQW
jgi:hypothetical protein